MNNSKSLKTKWKIIGPGAGGGVFIPTINPYNPGMVLMSCDMTPGFITYDGGLSWRNFHLKSRIHSFAFDPNNENVVYAGSTGLYRSDDRGEKWRLVFPHPEKVFGERRVNDEADHIFLSNDNWPKGHFTSIQCIRVDPKDSNKIYLGIKSEKLHIFFSDDRGETWNELYSMEGNKVCSIYAGITEKDSDSLYVIADTGFYKIDKDNSKGHRGFPEGANEIFHGAWGMDKETGAPVFYVLTASEWKNEKLLMGVWKSKDYGCTWEDVGSDLIRLLSEVYNQKREGLDAPELLICEVPKKESGKMPAFNLVAVHEADSRIIYLGTKTYPQLTPQQEIVNKFGVLKSIDGGTTWKWIMKSDVYDVSSNVKAGWVEKLYKPKHSRVGPKGVGPIGMGICPTNPDIFYFTDMGAAFKTEDGGETFEQVYCNEYPDGSFSTRGINTSTSYGIHFDPYDKNHLVISNTDIGVVYSNNDGNAWYHAIEEMPPRWTNTCYWLVFDPDMKDKVFSAWGYSHDLPRKKMFKNGRLGHTPGGVCKSEDGAKTWSVSNKGMDENSCCTHIILDPKSPPGNRTIYVTAFKKGVYKSTDDGNTWELKNNGITGSLDVFRLALLPDGTLYLVVTRGYEPGPGGAEIDGAIYKSTDGAQSWTRIKLPSGVNAPNDIQYDPSNPKQLYIACWPSKTINEDLKKGGVFVTVDDGESWTNILNPDIHTFAVTVDEDNPANLYVTTFNSATYKSEDKGRSWKKLKGFNFKWGHRVILDKHDKDMLYITTFGNSTWHGPRDGDPDAWEDYYDIDVKK